MNMGFKLERKGKGEYAFVYKEQNCGFTCWKHAYDRMSEVLGRSLQFDSGEVVELTANEAAAIRKEFACVW